MVKRIFFILLFTVSIFSQNVKVSAGTDRTQYKIGDYIFLKYEVLHNKKIEIFFPSFKDSLKKLELITQKPVVKTDTLGQLKSTYEFVLTGFDSGAVSIPAIKIFYKFKGDSTISAIQTDSLMLIVHTLKVDVGVEIKDVKEPERIPMDWRSIILWVLIISLVIVLGIYLFRKFKKRKKEIETQPEVVKEPHEVAFELLKELEEKKLWQNGKIKEYHSEITSIIRAYFERRFSLPALELTTSEVLYHLQRRSDTGTIYNLTRDFLNNADMVKFAKYIPMDKVNEEMMSQAVKIVELTVPVKVERGDVKNV